MHAVSTISRRVNVYRSVCTQISFNYYYYYLLLCVWFSHACILCCEFYLNQNFCFALTASVSMPSGIPAMTHTHAQSIAVEFQCTTYGIVAAFALREAFNFENKSIDLCEAKYRNRDARAHTQPNRAQCSSAQRTPNTFMANKYMQTINNTMQLECNTSNLLYERLTHARCIIPFSLWVFARIRFATMRLLQNNQPAFSVADATAKQSASERENKKKKKWKYFVLPLALVFFFSSFPNNLFY